MELPKQIFHVDYAGFFDFSEDGKYGDSVINVMDYENAEQIANEIAKRYNNHEQLVKALKEAQKLLQASASEVERPELERFLSGGYKESIQSAVFKDSLGIHALLSQLESK